MLFVEDKVSQRLDIPHHRFRRRGSHEHADVMECCSFSEDGDTFGKGKRSTDDTWWEVKVVVMGLEGGSSVSVWLSLFVMY